MVDGSTAIGGFSDISGLVGVENRGEVTSAQIGALKSVLSQGSPASGGTTTLPGPASGQVSSTANTPVVNTPTPASITAAFKDAKTPEELEKAKAVLYDALGENLCDNVSTAQAQWSGAQTEDNKVPWLKAANALFEKSNKLMGQLANNLTAPQALKDIIAGFQWLPNISDDYIINNISSFSAAEVKLAQTVAPNGRGTNLFQQAKCRQIQAECARIQPDIIQNFTSPATQDQIKAIKEKATNLLNSADSAEGLTTEQKEYLRKLSEASTLEMLKIKTPEQIKADAKNRAIDELNTLYSSNSKDFQALSKARAELAKNDPNYASLVNKWLEGLMLLKNRFRSPSPFPSPSPPDNYNSRYSSALALANYESDNFKLNFVDSRNASMSCW